MPKKLDLWLSYLNGLFEGDEDKVKKLRAFFRSTIYGGDRRILILSGGAGKTTVINVLSGIVGEGSVVRYTPSQIHNPFYVFESVGKSLNITWLKTKRGLPGFVGFLKSYHAGEKLCGEIRGLGSVSCKPTANIVVESSLSAGVPAEDAPDRRFQRLDFTKPGKLNPKFYDCFNNSHAVIKWWALGGGDA